MRGELLRMKVGLVARLFADPINTIPDASHQGLQFGFVHLHQKTEIDICLQESSDDFNQPILCQNVFRLISFHF